jgi:hypothetical protein
VGLIMCGVALSACGSSGGTRDEDLGGLVYAERDAPEPIDVDSAARDHGELLRAVSLGHRHVGALVGPHRFSGTSKVAVTEGGKAVEGLDETAHIALDADGNFEATLDNSREYGRHALYVDGVMYLRPRFGKYHQRPPADDDEPARVRDEIYGNLAAYLELLGPRIEVSDGGALEVAGRSARRITLSAAPAERPRPAERLSQRKWRESAVVRDVSGVVVLDREAGVPLHASVEGAVGFTRDGRTFEMRLSLSHELGSIGTVEAVVAPPAEETMPTPQRPSEIEERDALLQGLAAPAEAPAPPPPRPRRSRE